MKPDKRTRHLFFTILLIYLFAILLTGLCVLELEAIRRLPLGIWLAAAFFAAVSAGVVFLAKRITKKITAQLDRLEEKNDWFRSIVDAVPFPIHVIDNDMNWTFLNKAFEKLMTEQGTIENREGCYGRACSNAGANICNTDACGIRQLHKGVGESYFDWCGMNCKQDTSYLLNKKGERVGYVEVVTDLTSLIRSNEFNKTEIKRLVGNLNRLASGDLELDLAVTPADRYTEQSHSDFLLIRDSLAKVRQALERMIADAEELTQAAVDGLLSTRADASRHEGSYRAVVEGVNATLNAVIGPLHVAAAYVDKISKGDIPPKITQEYRGDFEVLKHNLNTCIDAVNVLVEDAAMLAEAAEEGRLEVRADVSRHHGDFRRIVEGVNNTLDSIITPFNEVSFVLDKIAFNDLEHTVQGEYKGKYKELTDSINNVRTRLLSVEDAFVRVANGDTTRLEEFRKVGKRSENDRLMPAAAGMMQAIRDLGEETNRVATAMVEGNLSFRGDADHFRGSYRQIIEGMNRTMVAVETPIDEISAVLGRMADGDLSVTVAGSYHGAYERIQNATNRTLQNLNEVLSGIELAADEVAAGSNHVAGSSQALSQGATEQASSIEQLSASITEIASQTKQNSKKAAEASELALRAKTDAGQGNARMQLMLTSMQEINDASTNISKIIKVIDDIAFQTNILALNAAVEAARAGQYGKGFAVVAEEVRNLAARSAGAARETTDLIESSMGRTEAGTRIARQTAEALGKIVEGIDRAAALVSEISSASNEQATGISQVNMGIEQVSQVVQTNSATAEESAASSEELSSQAELLKKSISRFRLAGGHIQTHLPQAAAAQAPAEKRTITLKGSDFGKF